MRAICLTTLILGVSACYAETPKNSETQEVIVRGKLTQAEGKQPVLATSDGKQIAVEGDGPTNGVLNDKRLAGADFEVRGHYAGDVFQVDPIHMHALHVHKGGKRLAVTYWCDICSIRYYTPGRCWCCQNETDLDLREPGPDEHE